MFTPDSRYPNQPIYTVTLPDGTLVTRRDPAAAGPGAAGRLLPARPARTGSTSSPCSTSTRRPASGGSATRTTRWSPARSPPAR